MDFVFEKYLSGFYGFYFLWIASATSRLAKTVKGEIASLKPKRLNFAKTVRVESP